MDLAVTRTCPMRIALAALVLLGAAAPAWGGPPDAEEMLPAARGHLERGRRHYDVQEYDAAITEFKAGYKLDPRPVFLYALGQAQRQKGDCANAIRSYQAFLRTNPNPRHTAVAQDNLARCEAALRAARPGPPAPRVEPAPAPPAPATAAAPAAIAAAPATAALAPASGADVPRRWYRDPLGGTLTVTGVLALAAGAALWTTAHLDIESARGAASYRDYAGHAAGAETRQIAGVATVAVGGALVAAGILRYLLLRPRSRTTVGAAPARGGGLVLLGGGF